ncbi:MAG: peptidylprolyl isomerase [Saprospiraceae bacterium]|nr:peptidylprolyl isomerase [Saprospiraceae bacterium]
MIRFLSLFLLIALAWSLPAQNGHEDPVLFTVNGDPVHVSEFVYIYEKTNGDKADYSRGSVEEYLRLYTKFKLKVQKAKELKLDTIQSLQQELEGYRRQLADSYLIDKEVTERLIQEAYERVQQDVDISHLVIAVDENATPDDTIKAYQRALVLKKRIAEGERFDSLALQNSADKSVTKNLGRIGYVTALFPNGFYPLETAAYTQPIGVISDPIRTTAGYHLLIVHDRRPARGEVEVAHILIRKGEMTEKKDAKAIIDQIYAELQNGADFDELAKTRSEDKRTAAKGGYLGTFGINRYDRKFEDAAFSIPNDGGYSKPVETTAGWHIIKRISKKETQPYNIARGGLQSKIKNDARFEAAKLAMIEKIKKESNFIEFNTTLVNFTDTLTEDFLTYKWKAPEKGSEELLFAFGKTYKVTLGDFTDFLGRATRQRIRMGRNTPIADAVKQLYGDFVNESTLKYEEQQLEKKYPDFKSLMREYEEGILLFEATKMLVWDKAAQDSVGLEKYFAQIKGKYKWRERAISSLYTIKSNDADLIDKVYKFAAKNSPDKVLHKFNEDAANPVVSVAEQTYEKGRNKVLDDVVWKVGGQTAIEHNDREGTHSFIKIEKILPEEPKSLDEARGYVIADYQDYLERQWVEELRNEYKVEVDRNVFDNLVRQ